MHVALARPQARKPAPLGRRGIALASAITVMVGAIILGDHSVASAAGSTTGGTEIVRDDFSRTTTGGWGSAAVGGAYKTAPTDKLASFSVTPGVASFLNIAPGTSLEAALSSPSAVDVETEAVVTLPSVPTTAFAVYYGLESRRQANGSAYFGRLEVGAGGKASVAFTKVVAGVESRFGNVLLPFKVPAGKKVHLRTLVSGTNQVSLKARAWLDGTAEPAWQLSAVDSSSSKIATTGSVGVWAYVSSSSAKPVVVQTNSFSAWKVGAATPTTPPTTSTSAPAPTTAAPTTTAQPTTTAPTTTVPPAPAPPATQSGRGAAVGASNYAIPAGALFVDPNTGNDGAAGTQAAPLRTVAVALNKAKTGGTIVLRKGNYHEKVMTPAAKALTIQAYPREAVWFDGSVPVTGWTKSGSNWVHSGWTTQFDHSTSFAYGQNNAAFVNAAYPMAAHPDQVFVDGAQLRQVASAAAVTAGTFAVDYATDKITIGSDPTGKEVRSSDLDQAITVAGAGTKLYGFGVRRYGNPIPRMGAVYVGAANARLSDLVFQDNATTGLSLYSPGIVVDHLTITKSGLIGIQIDKSDNLSVSNSVFNGNNSEHFNPFPVSAGFKITKSQNVKINNNDVIDNINCLGIWLDQSNLNVTITNNRVMNNGYAQIEAEISQNVVIAGNIATGGNVGIFVYNAGNVKVYNNTLGGSSIQEINLTQDERRSGNPLIPWLLRDVYIANNVLGTGGVFQIMALDKATHIPADQMNITTTGNLFNPRPTTASPTLVGWGLSDNTTRVRYDSVAALKAKNSAWNNAQTATVKTFNLMTADAAAAAPSVAVGLPADIAAAMGQPAGTKRIGAFIPFS